MLRWFTVSGQTAASILPFSEMDNVITLLCLPQGDCTGFGRPSAKMVFGDLGMKRVIIIYIHLLLLAAKPRTTLADDLL